MFKNTRDFFSKSTPLQFTEDGVPLERDIQLAVLVLLLDAADSDGHGASEEIHSVMKAMSQAFGLQDNVVGELVEIAQIIRQDNSKREEFIRSLNKHFSHDQRRYLMALIWKVALADGAISSDEVKFATHFRLRLELSPEAAILARKEAEQ